MQESHAPRIVSSAPKLAPSRFSPYVDNGGTTAAVVGSNFCVIAADTRMSLGYSIPTRNFTKLVQLTPKAVLASSGMQGDILTIAKRLKWELKWYEHQHGKTMSTPALAQFLGNILYSRRFFPYYANNILAGIDENGVGCCWTYDSVGSHERVVYGSSGSGQGLIQPFLDNQVAKKNQVFLPEGPMTLENAKAIVRDALCAAAERDIHTGDYMDMIVLTPAGLEQHRFELKFD
ncbi:proteasome subunit beta type 1 [Pelomyxa schiedti]|nr:proteasome subunit beta type 1 [Pelomyxa schiedti]